MAQLPSLAGSDDTHDERRVLAVQDLGDARDVGDDVAAGEAAERPHHDQMDVHESLQYSGSDSARR